jgi:acetoacetyl-CoA synthetase
VVEALPEVAEALAFGQQWDDDVRIVLLVKLTDGAVLTDDLRSEIRSKVRAACTPRHVPAVIAQVDDLPRTRSNKLVELAVADAVHGRPVRNTEAIVNPEAIDAIVALAELHR